MAKENWEFYKIRFRHFLNRLIWLDFVLIGLLLCGFYLLGQIIGDYRSATTVTALLATLNVLIGTAVVYFWISFLWRRLPTWLAIGGVVLTMYALTTQVFRLPVSFIAGPDITPQILTTLFGVGLLGSVIALIEITRSAQTKQESHYLAVLTRHEALPSFTGFGSLIINSVVRICRDRLFVATLALFIIGLLIMGLSTIDAGSYLVFLTAGALTLTIIATNRLVGFSSSLMTKFPNLPISHQMIDFAAAIAGLLLVTVISFAISLGVLQLGVVNSASLVSIALTGQIISYFVAASSRHVDSFGVFGAWWIVIIEAVALLVTYRILVELNILGNLLVLLFVAGILFSSAFYQARDR